MITQDSHPYYGELISTIIRSSANLQQLAQPELSKKAAKRLRAQLVRQLDEYEQPFINAGVNFSRAQISVIRQRYAEGKVIEFETVGPYLANYLASGGTMTLDNLIPEDLIGVRLAALFRTIFPKARLAALCDEYNQVTAGQQVNDAIPEPFTQAQKQRFLASFKTVLTQAGALSEDATEWNEYILQAESDNAVLADRLVALLDEAGHIQNDKGALYFVNPEAENPLHQRFCLRTAQGRWLCETLDAAGFLQPINRDITHLVVLPSYMRTQQDRVWEILRVLGFTPSQHHNLFFDPEQPVDDMVRSIAKAFSHT
jgi:hypothetical protein